MAIKMTKGSHNVFRDLGYSAVEAEHLRVRAELIGREPTRCEQSRPGAV